MIDYQLRDKTAIIMLDDGKANVFSKTMSYELQEALSKAEHEANATILMGREGFFSAGFDLKVLQSGNVDEITAMIIAGFETLIQVASHPQPTLAACTGNAMGLGAFILLVADTRIGAEAQYSVSLPETRAGMQFTPLLITAAQARLNPMKYVEAALQSMPYSPQDAITAGFLDALVAPTALLETALQTATKLSTLPSATYQKNKHDLLQTKLETMQKNLDEIKANPLSLATAMS